MSPNDGTNFGQFGWVGCANHESSVAHVLPCICSSTRNVFVQGLVVDELRLELTASFVAGATENDGSLVWGAKERLE